MPDALWRYYLQFRDGKPYSRNQAEDMATDPEVLRPFDEWVNAFANEVLSSMFRILVAKPATGLPSLTIVTVVGQTSRRF